MHACPAVLTHSLTRGISMCVSHTHLFFFVVRLYCLARCSGGVGRGDGSCLRAVSQKSDRARGPCGRSCGQRGGVGGRESMQGRGGKAQACGVSMQGGYVYIADTSPHTRVHLEVSGPAPGQWNTRTPAALCARRFCGSFFRRASHSQPAGPRTARAGRGARSGDPSPHLSGPDWSPRPAWTTSWCKRVKRRAPASPPVPAHTPAHTPAHAPAQHDFDADDSERRTIGGNGTRHAPAPHPQMAPGCPHTTGSPQD